MNIGIFDSGLGGLILMKPVVELLPEYDYIYLGDTANLPYGDKSQDEIFALTKRALDYLFAHQCAIVFVFCNTASASALRKLQHEGYRALGVIIPTVEVLRHTKNDHPRVGVLATKSTVQSGKYPLEIKKILPHAKVFQQAAPKLVPMIETGIIDHKIVDEYLEPLLAHKIDTLILGCTHYGIIRDFLPKNINVICQEDIIAPKVFDYLQRHPEIESQLTKNKKRTIFFSGSPDFEGW